MKVDNTTQISNAGLSSKTLLWGAGCLGFALLGLILWFFLAIAVLNYFSAPRPPNVDASKTTSHNAEIQANTHSNDFAGSVPTAELPEASTDLAGKPESTPNKYTHATGNRMDKAKRPGSNNSNKLEQKANE